jgi:hypothetical protein
LLTILTLLFLIGLFLLSYQDFKERKVTALIFFYLAILGGYMHYTTQYIEMYLFSLVLNFSILLFLILILLVYAKFVMRKKINETIGLGDVLFFGVLALSFPTVSFLILFSSSLIFSLVTFLFLKQKIKVKTVPLAGLQGVFLAIVMILNLFFNLVDLYLI